MVAAEDAAAEAAGAALAVVIALLVVAVEVIKALPEKIEAVEITSMPVGFRRTYAGFYKSAASPWSNSRTTLSFSRNYAESL